MSVERTTQKRPARARQVETLLRRCLLLLILCGTTAPAMAVAPVEVLALFKDRAVLKVGYEQAMLKVGETAAFGATLVSAGPKGATVRYEERLYELKISNKVSASFTSPTVRTVRLQRDNGGQYRSVGLINGQTVTLLVDTGASAVGISQQQADLLGIDYNVGRRIDVTTAQGVVRAYIVSLSSVSVGVITLRDVEAFILPGAFPTEVLLGMTFLNRLKMQNEAGMLLLSTRY